MFNNVKLSHHWVDLPDDYHWKYNQADSIESRRLHLRFGKERSANAPVDMKFTFKELEEAMGTDNITLPYSFSFESDNLPPVRDFLTRDNPKINKFIDHFLTGQNTEPFELKGVLAIGFKFLGIYWDNTDAINKETAKEFFMRRFSEVKDGHDNLEVWLYGMKFYIKIDAKTELDYDNMIIDKSKLAYDDVSYLHGTMKIAIPFTGRIYPDDMYKDVNPTLTEARLEKRYKDLRPLSCDRYSNEAVVDRISLSKDTLKTILDYNKYPGKIAFAAHDKGVSAGLASMDVDAVPVKQAIDKQFSYVSFYDKVSPYGFLVCLLHMYGDPEKFKNVKQPSLEADGINICKSTRIEKLKPCNYYINSSVNIDNEATGIVIRPKNKNEDIKIDVELLLQAIENTNECLLNALEINNNLKEFVLAHKEDIANNLKEFTKDLIVNAIKDDPARYAAISTSDLSYSERLFFFKNYATGLVNKISTNDLEFDIEDEETNEV